MPNIRGIISRSDKRNLQTRTLSFPDQQKLLKQVDGGWTITFYR